MPSVGSTYRALVKRRATGEPMQYIIGECEFFGLPFKVSPAVLIPRPETEHLVEVVLGLVEKNLPQGLKPGKSQSEINVLAEARTLHNATGTYAEENILQESKKLDSLSGAVSDDLKPLRIVDVGTGSGAIAVTLALKLESTQVTAIDLSADALDVARENAERNGARVRLLHGDLLAPVVCEHFDFVVSNPPYVPDVEKAWLSVDVRDHEPHLALFGGEDGLGIYRRLIPQAKDVLVSGGWLVMEMGFGQCERVQDLMEQMEFKEIEIVPDLQGIERIILGRK